MFNILFRKGSEEIQYLGTCYTQDCLEALGFILQTQKNVKEAKLLSNNGYHAFLILSERNTYIIHSGFTSGYLGEGSKGLASALQLLLRHEVGVEEILITNTLMKKLNTASLNNQDIHKIQVSKVVRPIEIYEYIYAIYKSTDYQISNNRYYPTELPYHLIDPRIFDLALKFKDNPNSAILIAYTRLEDIVKIKINNHSLFSNNLLKTAFISEKERKSLHYWNTGNEKSSNAIGSIFTNIFSAYRNERAHSEIDKPYQTQIREFLLINELYLLEHEAIERI